MVAPLDLTRAFHPDDDRDEMRHFLETAGFLHIAGPVRGIGDNGRDLRRLDRAAPTYTEGDGRSWWARTSGRRFPPRPHAGFDRESDGARRLDRRRAVPRPRVDRGGRATGSAR